MSACLRYFKNHHSSTQP